MGHDDLLGTDSHIDLLTDQPTGNRVRVGSHLGSCCCVLTRMPASDVVRVEPMSGSLFRRDLLFGEAICGDGRWRGDRSLRTNVHVVAHDWRSRDCRAATTPGRSRP